MDCRNVYKQMFKSSELFVKLNNRPINFNCSLNTREPTQDITSASGKMSIISHEYCREIERNYNLRLHPLLKGNFTFYEIYIVYGKLEIYEKDKHPSIHFHGYYSMFTLYPKFNNTVITRLDVKFRPFRINGCFTVMDANLTYDFKVKHFKKSMLYTHPIYYHIKNKYMLSSFSFK